METSHNNDGKWPNILSKFKGRTTGSEKRIQRRRALTKLITRRFQLLRLLLFCFGYIWMLLIPTSLLERGTYMDENAIQPGQVKTYWDWADVHTADKYLDQLEGLRDTNATNKQKAHFLKTEFQKMGLSAATQRYRFLSTDTEGENTYAVLSSPRASGTEAMVISASWLSNATGDTLPNLRGISTVLALANFLKRYSLWAKDIIFVVSDGYVEGMHAWLTRYHDAAQSNLFSESLEIPSSVIWTALNIDYPGHSFSHLGIYFEGLNGRLPNQDLLNTFERIARYTGGVPVVLYDQTHTLKRYSPTPKSFTLWQKLSKELADWPSQSKQVMRHVMYQARGQSSGVHGLFHQFRIDAFTMFAVPATGPHGFHALGRIVESTLRSMNNLLERLHASFFFYLMTGPEHFIKIGGYLPSVVLISIAMMFGGLRTWVDAAWVRVGGHAEKVENGGWARRRRPVMPVLAIMTATHILGATLFLVLCGPPFLMEFTLLRQVVFGVLSLAPLFIIPSSEASSEERSSYSTVLKAFNLFLASTVISIIVVLNFSLAAVLAVLWGLPLSLSTSQGSIFSRIIRYLICIGLGLGWLVFFPEETRKAMLDWQMYSVWFAPFVCTVYMPLFMQAGLVSMLPA